MKHLLLMAFAILTIGCGEKDSDGDGSTHIKNIKIVDGTFYLKKSDKLYTGKIIDSFNNGGKKLEFNIKNGKPHGLSTQWYENGKMQAKANNRNGKHDGLAERWYENGKKADEATYKEGKQSGIVIHWHENGQKAEETTYKGGEANGPFMSWHENGQKESEGKWKNGQQEGLVTSWYENGQKESEENWKNDKAEGLLTEWYEDGQKKSEGNWKDGKKEGPSASWHENGQKMENATYKKGKPDGRSLAWHENGQMKSETNWKNGQIDGTLTLWHKNGKKMLQGAVKGGKPNSIQFWNSKGEEVDSQEEAGLNGPLFEALGGVGFAYYTMKMNEDSYKAIAIPVKGLPTELCEDWEAAFQEVLSNEAILQEIADETQYAEKLGVPSEEAVSHLKEAIKVRFVKRNNWIEIGLVGKRKQNEDLMKIAELLHETAVENIVKIEPSFQQYLDAIKKQQAAAKSRQP